MSSRLEQFIRDHREEFDSEEPGKQVWDNIRIPEPKPQGTPLSAASKSADTVSPDTKSTDATENKPDQHAPSRIFRLPAIRWTAAAAVVLLIAGIAWWAGRHGTGSNPSSLASGPSASDTNSSQHANPSAATDPSAAASQKKAPQPLTTGRDSLYEPSSAKQTPAIADTKRTAPSHSPAVKTGDTDEAASDYQEEMAHYARLVELRHKELKHIEKDEPLLYKQFAGDVDKLDSVYHSLEKRLTTNPNREQLLEAMLQNLQLQMELLNHQLKIIRQINHSKKTAYENAYKTI